MPRKKSVVPDALTKIEESLYTITRHSRYWQVRDAAGELVCVTVYKRGAQEVVRRLCA